MQLLNGTVFILVSDRHNLHRPFLGGKRCYREVSRPADALEVTK
jgi:hypothetical protein